MGLRAITRLSVRLALPGIGLLLATACAPDHRGEAVQHIYVSSDYGVAGSPYAYSNPAPYGYNTPWGQPSAETVGYLTNQPFSPRQGLVCEPDRHACYTVGGMVDDAETERYLGSRELWERQRLYAPPQAYIHP